MRMRIELVRGNEEGATLENKYHGNYGTIVN